MRFSRPAALALAALLLLPPSFAAAALAQAAAPRSPQPTADVVERIKDEAINRSQVMETLAHLTEVIGPRLTGSPAMKRANEWTRDRLTRWGLENARLHPWQFGRGWTLKRFSAEVTAPQAFPLLAYPRAWSPGLDRPLTSEVVLVEAADLEQLQKYKGQLRGKIVLTDPPRETRPRFEPRATRLSDGELLERANEAGRPITPLRPVRALTLTPEQLASFRSPFERLQFFADEGAALLVGASGGSDGGQLQHVGSARALQARDVTNRTLVEPWQAGARVVPQIALSLDDYNRLARMIRAGERPVMSVNLRAEFDDTDPMSYNTLADIIGADLKDEVVMIGAHLDSWHTGTGATDNATGVAIMMEAARIIKALNLRPRRTIRVALWGGEEQVRLGSQAYVAEQYGSLQATSPDGRLQFKPAYENFNVYFNLDSGTGAIRGIPTEGNEALRPVFRQWLAPFRELKVGQNTYSAQTISAGNSGGSDYQVFDAINLIGLEFIQDEIEYGTRTWHTNQDTYDRVIPEDLRQAAAVVAWFAYNAATSDEKLPRKPRARAAQQ